MAVDSLLNKVVELTQGGSTTNQVTPVTSRGRTLTGITTGTDHLVFGTSSIIESTDGRTTTWDYGPLDATIEMVVELNPTWTYASLVAKGYMWYLACADSGVLRLVLGYVGNYVEYDFSVPTTGKTYISIRLVKDATYGSGLDLHLVIQPQSGTRRTLTREFNIGSSIMLRTTNASYGRIADVLLGAMPYENLSAVPGAEASASWATVTEGYVAANSARPFTSSESFARIFGVQYTPPNNPNNVLDPNYWRTLGAQLYENGVPVGSPIVTTLDNVAVNSMTQFQAATILYQQLAAMIPGASVGTSYWESAPVVTNVLETLPSGYQRPTGETYLLSQPYDRVHLTMPLYTSASQTWEIRGRSNGVADSPITDWASMFGMSYTPGVYGAGVGQRAVGRLTVSKYTSGSYLMYFNGAYYPMDDISVNGALHQALITAWAGQVTANAVSPTTTVFTMTFANVGDVGAMGYTPYAAVYEQNSAASAITKLYALRVTEADRAADAAFPALPWPTSTIPPATGGGALPTDVIFAVNAESNANDVAQFGLSATASGTATIQASGSRTSDGYLRNTDGAQMADACFGYTPNAGFKAAWGAAQSMTLEFDIRVDTGAHLGGQILGIGGGYTALTSGGATGVSLSGSPLGVSAGYAELTSGQWHHIAFVADYNGGSRVIRVYRDGVEQGTGSSNGSFDFNDYPNPTTIGLLQLQAGFIGNGALKGGMDNIVLTTRAKYNANFTPPGAIVGPTPISASPLYLKFEDGAGNATALNQGTGGGAFPVTPHAIVSSQHQDGVGSLQLTGAAYDSMSFASITGPLTGDYTAEMWVRFPALPATAGMFMSPYTHGFALGATGVLSLFTDSGSSSLDTAAGAVSANVWYHIAAVRTSGTVKFYFNGVSQEVGATGQTSSVAAPFALGEDGSYGSGVAAFIDEYRFTNSALYTSNFTPESPLDDTPIVAPTNDVTGAGYNDIEELLGSGTGNTQANAPDAYGTSNVVLVDTEAAYTAYVDAADITGTGTTTLAAATNSGAGVAATPTNLDGDNLLDDFTSVADGVADMPLEFTADYTLDDFTGIAVGLFLAPVDGIGDGTLDDFAVTDFAIDIMTPPTAQATFSLPMLRATASGSPAQFSGALVTLPEFTLTARGGHNSTFSLPRITAEATGTTIAMARAIMTIPMVEVEASGRVAGQSSVQTRLPRIEVSSFGGHQAEVTLPEITASASATVGNVARAELSLPRITVTAHGYRDDTARADITLPMLVMTPSAVAEITLPAFTVLAHGQPVLTNAYEAYVLNMNQPLDDNPRNNFEAKVEQVTRYTNWPFIQVVRLGSTYYGVAEDGLYELGGTTDNGTEITWSFETCKTDFDDPHKKAVASAYIGGQAGATVDYTLRSGDDVDHMYGYVTTKVIQKRNHRQKFGLGRRVRYYSFGLAGSGKAAIDMLEFELLNTTRRI